MAKIHSFDDKISFYNIDVHARQVSASEITDISDLILYLSEATADCANKELLLARGFLVWLSGTNIQEFVSLPSDGFKTFCDLADIENIQISGKVKGSTYRVGDEDVAGSSWNAFKAGSKWHLVDPRWCIELIMGSETGGKTAIEADGTHHLKTIDYNPGTTVATFNEDWFCTEPNIFLLTHFPDEPQWQLTSRSNHEIDMEKWLMLPFLETGFFKLGLRLLSEECCVLSARKGKCSIAILGSQDIFRNVSFSYNLYIQGNDLLVNDLPLLVLPGRNVDVFQFEIRLPVEGTYFIEILSYNQQSEEFRQCCEFRLDCHEADANCRKLPVHTGIIGFGYGAAAEEAGLQKPSVPGSKVVINQSQDEWTGKAENKNIEFKVDADAMEEYEYGSCMCEDEKEEQGKLCDEATVKVNVNKSKRLLQVTPPVRPDCEYALVVTKRKRHSKEDFKPVLYYLVTTDEDDNDDNEQLQELKKEKLHEVKLKEKTEKNLTLREKILEMKAAIDKINSQVELTEETLSEHSLTDIPYMTSSGLLEYDSTDSQ